MKRKRFSEEQIIGILKEAEAGAVVTELYRKHGMSNPMAAVIACPVEKVADRVLAHRAVSMARAWE